MHHKSQQKYISDDLLLQKQSMHSSRSSIAETTWKYLIWIGIHFFNLQILIYLTTVSLGFIIFVWKFHIVALMTVKEENCEQKEI